MSLSNSRKRESPRGRWVQRGRRGVVVVWRQMSVTRHGGGCRQLLSIKGGVGVSPVGAKSVPVDELPSSAEESDHR